MEKIKIPFKEKEIDAVLDYSSELLDLKTKNLIILTHGVGGDLHAPQLTAAASYFKQKNFVVLRFTCKGLNIKYRINVYKEIINYIHHTFDPKSIFIGGRSMGARAAVMVTEELDKTFVGFKIRGIICFSYPLHKANQVTELRDEPLKKSKHPMFFLSGTVDEMCRRSIFEKSLKCMKAPYKVHWLEGLNHAAKPVTDYEEDMYVEAFREIHDWCLSFI